MRVIIRAAMLLITLGPVSAAWATTVEFENAVNKAMKFGQDRLSSAERRDLASAALRYWKSFDARLPRNSPADQDWLMGELETTDMQRLGMATASRQYALWQLSEYVDRCKGDFETLSAEATRTKLDEMYLWLHASYCYGNAKRLLDYLRQAGLSSGRYDGEFKMQAFSLVFDSITGKVASSILEGR